MVSLLPKVWQKKQFTIMKIISTKVHGVLDYLMGAILIAAPWLLNFDRGGAETWVPVVLGASVILYSLFTNYEYSVAKGISMRTHLTLDVLSGIFLAASPWIFGFSEYVYLPHLIFGILEVGAGSMTATTPHYRHEHAH
jgi:SPW repeat